MKCFRTDIGTIVQGVSEILQCQFTCCYVRSPKVSMFSSMSLMENSFCPKGLGSNFPTYISYSSSIPETRMYHIPSFRFHPGRSQGKNEAQFHRRRASDNRDNHLPPAETLIYRRKKT